jgi:hypothetical protein
VIVLEALVDAHGSRLEATARTMEPGGERKQFNLGCTGCSGLF